MQTYVELNTSNDETFYTAGYNEIFAVKGDADLVRINLYTNKAPKNQVDKQALLEYRGYVDGVFRRSTSIIEPTIILELKDKPNFNYIYIVELNRYYFVRDIIYINSKMYEIHCYLDPLYTYVGLIANQKALVDRTENLVSNSFNKKIEDNKLIIEAGFNRNVIEVESTDELFKNYGYYVISGYNINSTEPIAEPTPTTISNDIVKYYSDASYKSTAFCRSLVLESENALTVMVNKFNDAFSNISSFKNEISSIIWYPVKPQFLMQNEGWFPMTTTKPDFDYLTNPILCRYIDTSHMYDVCKKKIEGFYNSFLDYKGYTYIKLFLPYFGFIDVDVNEVMNRTLYVKLGVDFTNGSALYIIATKSLDDLPDEKLKLISTFGFEIGSELSLGSSNYADMKRNMYLGAVRVAASAAITAYTGIPSSIPLPQQEVLTVKSQGYNSYALSTQLANKQLSTTVTPQLNLEPIETSIPINLPDIPAETIMNNVNSLGKIYPTSPCDRVNDGNLMSFLNTKSVYIYIYRPNVVAFPEDYKEYYGLPVGKVMNLNDCYGFTKISSIHFEDINTDDITDSEIDLITKYLFEGVILPYFEG